MSSLLPQLPTYELRNKSPQIRLNMHPKHRNLVIVCVVYFRFPLSAVPRIKGPFTSRMLKVTPLSMHTPTQVVAFPTDEDAQKARKAWTAGAPYKGKVTSMNPKATKWPKMKIGSPETDAFLGFAAAEAKKKAKKKKGRGGEGKTSGGGGAGGAGSAGIDGAGDGSNASGVNKIAPPGTEVLLVVAPKQGELSVSLGKFWQINAGYV